MPTPLLTPPAGRKISDGLSLAATVPQNTTIPQGGFALLGGFLGMCVQGAQTGAGETTRVTLLIEQCEYETAQIDPAQPYAVGAAVYWDDAAKRLTGTVSGNRYAGRVTQAKDANNVIWFLLGPEGVTGA